MKKEIRIIDTKKIYSGDISFRLDKYHLKNKIIKKEVVEHLPSVGIIPIFKNDLIVFVSQYRHAIGKTILEIPAGGIERGEIPHEAAVREMAEEIGYTGKIYPMLRLYLAPGYDTEIMDVFIATNLKKIERGNLDDDEDIEIRRMKVSTAIKKCLNGEIQDCKTIAALLAYAKISEYNHGKIFNRSKRIAFSS